MKETNVIVREGAQKPRTRESEKKLSNEDWKGERLRAKICTNWGGKNSDPRDGHVSANLLHH